MLNPWIILKKYFLSSLVYKGMETLDAFIDFGKENSVTETPVYLNNIEKEISKLKMKYTLSQ